MRTEPCEDALDEAMRALSDSARAYAALVARTAGAGTIPAQPVDSLGLSAAKLYDALWLLKQSRLGDAGEFPTLPEVRAAVLDALRRLR